MKKKLILDYFDELFLNPRCELNYKKDYELLIAIVLSAQTTDKRVNKVTEVLFKKYPSIRELSEAPISDIENIIGESYELDYEYCDDCEYNSENEAYFTSAKVTTGKRY